MTKSNIVIHDGLEKTRFPRVPRAHDQYEYRYEGYESKQVVNEISKEDFENLRLISKNNQVLILFTHHNKDERTESGIFVTGDYTWDHAGHADRVGTVVRVPESLYYKDNTFDGDGGLKDNDPRSMDHQCDMELKEGDEVWVEYLDSLNCPVWIVDGLEYKLIKYDNIYLAKRKEIDPVSGEVVEQVIMLNGFCLFEPVKIDPSEVIDVVDENFEKKYDPMRGVVAYSGKPNREYRKLNPHNRRTDDMDIKIGDRVIFGSRGRNLVFLESPRHLHFDGKMYRVAKRWVLDAIEF